MFQKSGSVEVASLSHDFPGFDTSHVVFDHRRISAINYVGTFVGIRGLTETENGEPWKFGIVILWLVVEPTHLKNISQMGNLPQIGVKIKNVSNHHLVLRFEFSDNMIGCRTVRWAPEPIVIN